MVDSRKRRKLAKIVDSLRRDHIEVTENATELLFVSNSSHLVGVSFDCLESLFRQFDSCCTFTVYPNKSYSLVHFSRPELAVTAQKTLDGTKPDSFPEANAPVWLLFVKQLSSHPSDMASSSNLAASTMPNGLQIVPDFISAQLETELVQFVEHCLAQSVDIQELKNRRVFHFGCVFNYSENNATAPAPSIPPIFGRLIGTICASFECHSVGQPNQITVNVYAPGQGIPLHMDAHSAFEEPIYSLSLLSDVVMEFRDCANSARRHHVHLPNRSILLFSADARYRHKHGILTRQYDVHPMTNRLIKRQQRISITFRTVRHVPCQCSFVEFCDWDRAGRLRIPSGEWDGRQLEQHYVTEVYDAIASHFDLTRYANWRCVVNFLGSLPRGSALLDVGCGNGKYLAHTDGLIKIGCDISWNLLCIAKQKRSAQVFCADALHLPARDSAFDAVISVAVVHHFSTRQRRVRALSELLRVVRSGGRVLATAWAMEQFYPTDQVPVESIYVSKMRANKTTADDKNDIDEDGNRTQHEKAPVTTVNNTANKMLCIHDSKQFKQQDMLVPWSSNGSNRKQTEEPKQKQRDYFRYYHLFTKSEFNELIVSGLSHCCEIESENYDEGNWVVVLRKK